MTMNLPRDNKSSCEREVTLAPGQSLPWGSSLSRVHVNRPLDFNFTYDMPQGILFLVTSIFRLVKTVLYAKSIYQFVL